MISVPDIKMQKPIHWIEMTFKRPSSCNKDKHKREDFNTKKKKKDKDFARFFCPKYFY